MREVDTFNLRGLSIFRNISESDLVDVIVASTQEWVPERTVIMEEGRIPEYLFVIIRGSIDLFTNQGDRESTLTVLHSPRAFILAAVIGGIPAVQSARTLEPSYIVKVPAKVLKDLLNKNLEFAKAVARELSVSYGCVSIELKNQKLRTGIERLANWILRTHGKMGKGNGLLLPFDKRTLASRIGMTPENLSRSLTQLSKHGVRVRGRNVIITDYNALTSLARLGTVSTTYSVKECGWTGTGD